MRVALVSPYSWTFPGGVTRHIAALAEELLAQGHHVRVLSPYDAPGRLSAALHRGAAPQPLDPPDYLIPLGRTIGFKANGAVSNLSVTPFGVATMHRELRLGGFDVVHIHEPVAPVTSWVATDATRLPLVGTFHTYNENKLSQGIAVALGARRMLNHLHVRIAVSEAAAWTARRFYGGHYRIIPNGVQVEASEALNAAIPQGHEQLRIVFVGQAVERKGLPLLLRAFEALREHVPAELTVIGPTDEELRPLIVDASGIRILGKASDAQKQAALKAADVLCAPSLGGESFGMVLTEAFAAGTPVVAADIAGYRDVVEHDRTGILFPRGDAQALAERLRDLWHEPARRDEMALNAARAAERFAWPRVTQEVLSAYEDAVNTPAPTATLHRLAVVAGIRPADLKPVARPQRLPSPEPKVALPPRARAVALLRRFGLAVVSIGGLVLAVLALMKIGVDHVVAALATSSPAFVILGLAVMCSAMAVRAISWHAILQAALPRARVTLMDALQGTFIGVLMSSTLPARLGEPARAMVVARRTGRPRDDFPVVLGTLVSQTFLNLLALGILGVIMFSSVDIFKGHERELIAVAVAPLALLVIVAVLPSVLRHRATQRFQRIQGIARQARVGLTRVRAGLEVFRHPKLGAIAVSAQLAAWALQLLSCYLLLDALGLERVGLGGAAAVLFAVNITAVLPATPANVGVFQAACAAVLAAGWHVDTGSGVAYGFILQAVEVGTAVMMGMPALLKEGMSWREVRLRAMNTAPVTLPPRPGDSDRTAVPPRATS